MTLASFSFFPLPDQTENPKTTPCVPPRAALLLAKVTEFPGTLVCATHNGSLMLKRATIHTMKTKLSYARVASNFTHLFVYFVFSMH